MNRVADHCCVGYLGYGSMRYNNMEESIVTDEGDLICVCLASSCAQRGVVDL